MSKKSIRILNAIITSLQGLTYWVGHRQSQYKNYPLSEGAIVAEMCNLLYTNLPPDEILLSERMYKHLLSKENISKEDKTRVDLVVISKNAKIKKDNNENLSKFVSTIIEVKRGASSKTKISNDLKRLANIKESNRNIKCYLAIVYENKRPEMYVTGNGIALKRKFKLEGSGHVYKVKRVLKAAKSFNKFSNAQYACLLEVDMN